MAVLGQYELCIDPNTRGHLVWTIGNGDPMHGMCIPHRIPRTWEQQGEARGRSRHKNNSKIVRNIKERIVGTKRKCPKRGLTSAKDIAIELLEGY